MAATGGPDGLASELAAVLRRKAEALAAGTPGGLAAVLDDPFLYVNARGRSFGRADYVAQYGGSGPIRFIRQESRILEVADLGDCAMAAVAVDDQVEVGGAPAAWSFRSLCVFRRRRGVWRWAGGQTMPAPAE